MRRLRTIKTPLESAVIRGAVCSTTKNSVIIHQSCLGEDRPRYNKKTRCYEEQVTNFKTCGTVYLGYDEQIVAHSEESAYINSTGFRSPSKVIVSDYSDIPFILLTLGHALTKTGLSE